MKITANILLILASLFFFGNVSAQEYSPGVIWAKVKVESNQNLRSSDERNPMLSRKFKALGVNSFYPVIGNNHPSISGREGFKSDIDRIYKIKYDKALDVKEAIAYLDDMDYFEALEPNYIFELQYVPNDSLADSTLRENNTGQNQLHVHNFYKAWDITKGDTNVIMGIVDTGIEYDHEDIKGNLKINYADPINGINDDNDAFVWQGDTFAVMTDNRRGWDAADWDNDAEHGPGTKHGLEVTGVAAATADNDTGIAGTGFNCTYMPIKAAPNSAPTSLTAGYDGLLVAALTGCSIANLSWGSPVPISPIFQELIDYAALDLDVVIVAAAGNSGVVEDYIPASLDNVLSVTGIRFDSTKQGLSTVSHNVDICATGQFIHTTKNDVNGFYGKSTGTSVAAPVVTGAAGLIRSHRPDLNASQVMELLRVTATNIDSVNGNDPWTEKMGRMLNPVRALTDTVTPAVRSFAYHFDDHDGMTFSRPDTGIVDMAGDTLWIKMEITNYLASTKNLTIDISASSANFDVVDSVITPPVLNTWDSVTTDSFKIYVHASANQLEELYIRIGYQDSTLDDYQYVKAYVTPTLVSGHISSINSMSSRVFPNPFETQFTITSASFSLKEAEILVFDPAGKTVPHTLLSSEGSEATLKLATSENQKGIYFVKVKNKDVVETHKLIKL